MEIKKNYEIKTNIQFDKFNKEFKKLKVIKNYEKINVFLNSKTFKRKQMVKL
jgi:hypothetical protein